MSGNAARVREARRAGSARRGTGAPVRPAVPPGPALGALSLAGNRATSALLAARDGQVPPLLAGDVLALQSRGGNRAVQALVEPAAATVPNAGPADVNVGFNPMDRMHRLLIAIDQKQVDLSKMTRHVDFDATVAALADMTADQAHQVMDAYLAHEGRTLYNDLFGVGESGFHSDLALDQLMRLDALLSGTKAAGRSEAEVRLAAENRMAADAAELHGLLRGDFDEGPVERVMALLRRPAPENARLQDAYKRVTNDVLRENLARTGVLRFMRAEMLLRGDVQGADAFQVRNERARIEAIDARIAELRKDMEGFLGSSVPAVIEIRKLTDERKQQVQAIEHRLQGVGAEALAEAVGRNEDAAQVAGSVRTRVEAVAGDVAGLATAVGGADAAVIRAEATGDPVERVAAQLNKASAAGDLNAGFLTTALRGLRESADARAARELRGATAEEVAARGKAIADGYFDRLRASFDRLAGEGKHLDQLLGDTGNAGDVRLNQALMRGSGALGDVDELEMALAGDRKDMAAVERVLRNKSATDIANLQRLYQLRTGKALDRELFGAAPTLAGQENPEAMGMFLLDQGKASGTERLNLEDYLQRPEHEGGMEEVAYIAARAEREYAYTIEHRGATGWWRDTWGNEQRELLDETINRVRALQVSYHARWAGQPAWTHSAEAHQVIQQMRLARATIRGDRAAYEKATAELRATFQAIAAFALQVALTAVLGPVAELALVGELAEGASVALRVAKLAQGAAVATASTIGANLAVYGSDYSLAMLKADLLGGMGGAIGPAALNRMIGPYAKALATKLGPRASAEIIGLANTVASMETAALAQGETADFSVESVAKAHGMGKIQHAVSNRTNVTHEYGPPPEAAAPGAAVPESAAPGAAAPERAALELVTPEAVAPEAVPEPAAPRAPGGEVAAEPTQVTATPEGAVMQADDPHHPVEAWKLYRKQIAADPKREVALLYNHATDQWAVVQGSRGGVPTIDAMRRLGWEVKETTVGRHSHPVGSGDQTSEANMLASGRGADVDMVRSDAYKGEPTAGAQWHAIDVTMAGGKPDRTWVFYSRETGLWTIDFPDAGERGGRGRVSFSSVDQYHRWFRGRFGFAPGPERVGGPPGPAEATEPRAPGEPPAPDDPARQAELDRLIAEQAADQAEGDPGETAVEPGEEHVIDQPEYQQGIAEASDLFARLPNIEQRKNLASGADGDIELSGSKGEGAEGTDRARIVGMEAGHETDPHVFDRGTEGEYECTHSERKRAAMGGGQVFSSSKPVCAACQGWFTRWAMHEEQPKFIGEPGGVHVFLDNGRHILAPHPSGAVTIGPPGRGRR